MADKPKAMQKTQPQGKDEHGEPHEPVEIPVPKRGDFERLLKRAAKAVVPGPQKGSRK